MFAFHHFYFRLFRLIHCNGLLCRLSFTLSFFLCLFIIPQSNFHWRGCHWASFKVIITAVQEGKLQSRLHLKSDISNTYTYLLRGWKKNRQSGSSSTVAQTNNLSNEGIEKSFCERTCRTLKQICYSRIRQHLMSLWTRNPDWNSLTIIQVSNGKSIW